MFFSTFSPSFLPSIFPSFFPSFLPPFLLPSLSSLNSLKYFLGTSLLLIFKAYLCAQHVKSENVSLKFYFTI